MAVTLTFTNYAISVTLVLMLVYTTPVVHGSRYCSSTSIFDPPTICEDYEVCCGINNNSCCVRGVGTPVMMEVLSLLFLLFLFICCPVMCYRCCCRRTTNHGAIYHPAGTATSVTVSLPPTGGQQVPYPTVVPYPQQTPYPPQYPTNPYYGMPPPPYGVAVQGENQQASAPSAPYPHYPTS